MNHTELKEKIADYKKRAQNKSLPASAVTVLEKKIKEMEAELEPNIIEYTEVKKQKPSIKVEEKYKHENFGIVTVVAVERNRGDKKEKYPWMVTMKLKSGDKEETQGAEGFLSRTTKITDCEELEEKEESRKKSAKKSAHKSPIAKSASAISTVADSIENKYKEGELTKDQIRKLIQDLNKEVQHLKAMLKRAPKKMAKGGVVGTNKIKKVMTEFKEGDLKTSAGKKVINNKQAVAIALSEQRAYDKEKMIADAKKRKSKKSK